MQIFSICSREGEQEKVFSAERVLPEPVNSMTVVS